MTPQIWGKTRRKRWMMTTVSSTALFSHFASSNYRDDCYANNKENDPFVLKDLSYWLADDINFLFQFGNSHTRYVAFSGKPKNNQWHMFQAISRETGFLLFLLHPSPATNHCVAPIGMGTHALSVTPVPSPKSRLSQMKAHWSNLGPSHQSAAKVSWSKHFSDSLTVSYRFKFAFSY